MQKTSVKIDRDQKEKLEILQAKLRLEKKLSLDQYEILGKLISYALDNFDEINLFPEEDVFLTPEEINELEKEIITSAKEYDLDKSDDELIYGV